MTGRMEEPSSFGPMPHSPSSNPEQPGRIRKRPRPILSCLPCRSKKLKCDRISPCNQCTKTGKTSNCIFARDDQAGSESRKRDHASGEDAEMDDAELENTVKNLKGDHPMYNQGTFIASPPSATVTQNASAVPGANAKGGVLEDIQARLRNLERILMLNNFNGGHQIPIAGDAVRNGDDGERRDGRSSGHTAFVKIRGSQSRCYGQTSKVDMSHHFRDAQRFVVKAFIDPNLRDLRHELHIIRKEFPKKAFKKFSTTAVPVLQNSESILTQLLELLPSRAVCDTLTTLYVEYFERVYRILHIQTFLKDCQDFWEARETQPTFKPGPSLPQLITIITIASASDPAKNLLKAEPGWSDDNITKWLLLTEAWLNSQRGKHRIEMSFIQLYCLHVLAQELCSPRRDEHELWNLTGSLVRAAMTMGLQCDLPDSPSMPIFQNILRKRLWATIAELDFQASLVCGMPSMVQEGNFDHILNLPNVNDSDLGDDMTEYPDSRPLDDFTDSTLQLVLATSLPLRLRSANHAYHSNNDDYERALQDSRKLDLELERIPKALQFKPHPTDREGNRNTEGSVSLFHRILLDSHLRRVILFINRPFSMREVPGFEQSRAIATRHSLATIAYQDAFDNDSDYSRTVRNSFNVFFEDDIYRAAYNICMEIKMIGSTSLSPALGNGNAPTAPWPNPLAIYLLEKAPQADYPIMETKSYLANVVSKTLDSLNERPDLRKGNIKDPFLLSIILVYVKNEGSMQQQDAEATSSLRRLLRSTLERLRAKKGREGNGNGDVGGREVIPIQDPPTTDQYSPPSFSHGRRQSRRIREAVPFNPDPVSQEGFVPGTLGNEGLNGSFDPMMAGGDVYQTLDWTNVDMNTFIADFDFDFDFGPMIFDDGSSASESLWQ